MTRYYQPVAACGAGRSNSAQTLAGGWCWFDRVVQRERGEPTKVIACTDVPDDVMQRLTAPRADLLGLSMGAPQIMGIINATPDSFSDGNRHNTLSAAIERSQQMVAEGVTIIDIGGESTRPGADVVPETEEATRVAPVVAALRAQSPVAISIDTRKAQVIAAVAAALGSDNATGWMLNDVSALSFDPVMAQTAADLALPVCLMHAQGDPRTMQDDPQYDDVLLDVYDYLRDRIRVARDAGIPNDRIVVDPGIGFGKTQAHNLRLLQNLSLFHGLGVPILLGASRKRFIGAITGVTTASDRVAGSVAVALNAIAQGVQIIRVHDTADTMQALRMQKALIERV